MYQGAIRKASSKPDAGRQDRQRTLLRSGSFHRRKELWRDKSEGRRASEPRSRKCAFLLRLSDDFPVPAFVGTDAAEAAISAKTIQLPCDTLVCDAKSNG